MRTMNVRAQILISGRVQGVFFRFKILNVAKNQNVTGWVQNTSDGRVKALFEGEKKDVKNLIDFCRSGPPLAKVSKVDVQWKEYIGQFKKFNIRRSNNI